MSPLTGATTVLNNTASNNTHDVEIISYVDKRAGRGNSPLPPASSLYFLCNKPRGASPRHDYRSDEDGTILAHNYILHGSDWFGRSKKGGTLRGLRIK
jgi:hypothetical protein